MTAAAAPAPRSLGALLRDRTFGPFIVGKTISSGGNWLQQLTAAVLMFQLTGSTFMVGLVGAAMFAPPLFLSLWAGALSDRFDRRRLVIVARALSAVAVATPSVLLLTLGVDGFGGPPVLMVFAVLMGIGIALSVPSMQAIVPSLVPASDLEPALALNSVSLSLGRTVGPAVGGAMLLAGGPSLAFGVAAASHLVFLATLVRLSSPRRVRHTTRVRVLGGLGYVVRDRHVALLMLAVACLGVGADPAITLTPALAAELGAGSHLVGWFALWHGLGAESSSVTLGRVRRRLSLRATSASGFVVTAVGLVVCSFAASAPVVCAGFFIAGWGFMAATVGLNTRIQRDVPDALRGRVMALWGVAFLGSRPVAAAMNGWVADTFSTATALQLAAAVTVSSALLARHRREVR